jgi:hypothetical protein
MAPVKRLLRLLTSDPGGIGLATARVTPQIRVTAIADRNDFKSLKHYFVKK